MKDGVHLERVVVSLINLSVGQILGYSRMDKQLETHVIINKMTVMRR